MQHSRSTNHHRSKIALVSTATCQGDGSQHKAQSIKSTLELAGVYVTISAVIASAVKEALGTKLRH